MDNGDIYITHQITIQILLLFKRQEDGELGIRETQRLLHLKSPSTTFYHLNKLVEMGLMEKSDANKYFITKKGMDFRFFKFPVEITPQYILGKFVPKNTSIVIFIGTSLLLSLIVFLFDMENKAELIANNSLLTLLLVFVYIIKDWIANIKSYIEFTLDYQDNNRDK